MGISEGRVWVYPKLGILERHALLLELMGEVFEILPSLPHFWVKYWGDAQVVLYVQSTRVLLRVLTQIVGEVLQSCPIYPTLDRVYEILSYIPNFG